MMALRVILMALVLLAPATLIAEPFAWTVNSDDEFDADQLLRVDLATGAVDFVGPLNPFLSDVEGLALNASGELYAVDNGSKSLLRVDTVSAEATFIANRQANLGFLPSQTLDFGMTFACDGQLLLVAEQTQSLYSVDVETGQARVIGRSGALGDEMTAIASYGQAVFALAAGSGGLYRIDRDTAETSLLATLDGYNVDDAGLAFDEEGRLWAVLDGSRDENGNPVYEDSVILKIDVSTGDFVQVATTRTGLESLAITSPGPCTLGPAMAPAPVPALSPLGLALLVSLLAGVALIRLRRT